MATKYDICFVTVGDRKTAGTIASGLLKEKLAACVSAVPGVESSYWWKDRIETSSETLLIIKARRILRGYNTVREAPPLRGPGNHLHGIAAPRAPTRTG